jgi:hypothetical protein
MPSKVARKVARAILKLYQGDKTRWTQGLYAKDKEGHDVSPLSRKAVCWCLLGALEKVSSDTDTMYDLQNAFQEVRSTNVLNYNDTPKRRFTDIVKTLTLIADSK